MRYRAMDRIELAALSGEDFAAICDRLIPEFGEAVAASQAAAWLSGWLREGLLSRMHTLVKRDPKRLACRGSITLRGARAVLPRRLLSQQLLHGGEVPSEFDELVTHSEFVDACCGFDSSRTIRNCRRGFSCLLALRSIELLASA